jgi:hypothetical protein
LVQIKGWEEEGTFEGMKKGQDCLSSRWANDSGKKAKWLKMLIYN